VSQARAKARAHPALPPAEQAWLYDFHAGHAASAALHAAAEAFVARQRMESVSSYLDAAEAVLAVLSGYANGVGCALRQRVAWMGAACVALGDAAGARMDAAVRTPSLPAMMRLRGDDAAGTLMWALSTLPPPEGTPPPRFELPEVE
jgi:hypothetical protein